MRKHLEMLFKLQMIIVVLMLFISQYSCSTLLFPSGASTPTYSPRWVIYQTALSQAIVRTNDGLCEWDIFGVTDREVYVWALCQVTGPIGTAGSIPAVIYLGENGEIEKVAIPRDGVDFGGDVLFLFPPYVQARIFNYEFDGPAAEKHIDERMQSNGPPLIVLSGTPLP